MQFNINVSDHGRREQDDGDGTPYNHTWSEDHDYDYKSATISDSKRFDVAMFPNEAPVEVGDSIHVVIVSYSTGDSFGQEQGRHVQLWAFSNKDTAQQLVDAVDADADVSPDYDFDANPMEFMGVPICTNEWKGYFETFSYAGIETLFVVKG